MKIKIENTEFIMKFNTDSILEDPMRPHTPRT